jgi:ABC-2 type transport system ATP-binding protein
VTASEHLTAVAAIFGAPTARVREVMLTLDLERQAATRVEKLSGGERQRLAVATALVHGPDVLFLDEPTAGLDPAARHDLVALLHRTRDSGVTVVYTTHYLEEAERLCDTVSILDRGRLLTTAAPSRLIAEAGVGCSILLPAAVHQVDTIATLRPLELSDVGDQGVLVRTRSAAEGFAALTAAGIATTDAQVHNGTLESVFLALTGRSFTS